MDHTSKSPSQRFFSTAIRDALSGGAAAVVSSVILQPFDVIRTKLQLHAGADQGFASFRSTVRSIASTDGIRGFWSGTGPTVWRVLPGGTLFYFSLNHFGALLKRGETRPLRPTEALFAGLAARTIGCIALQPLTVVKTRFEAYGSQRVYRRTGEALVSIYRSEGLAGLFSGLIPTILRDAPYSGLNFALYTNAKTFLEEHFQPSSQFELAAIYVCSAGSSGFLSTLITHPFDVVRTRLQTQPRGNGRAYRGSIDAFTQIIRTEGAATVFRGLAPRLIRRPLASAITWSFYETLRVILHQM